MTVDKLLDAVVAAIRAATTTHLVATNMRVYKGYPEQMPKSRTICVFPASGAWMPIIIGAEYTNDIAVGIYIQCPVVDDATTSKNTAAQQYSEFLEITEEMKILLASNTCQRLVDTGGDRTYRVQTITWKYGWPEDPVDRRKLYACEFEVVWRVPHS
jgi:hypothetical protein